MTSERQARFAGKVALITGAGKRSGIGFGIAEALAKDGADVILADLGYQAPDLDLPTGTQAEMDRLVVELQERYGVSAMAVPLDVCEPASIEAMVTAVTGRFPRVDILCNNAGASFGVPNLVHFYDEAAWMKTLDVNLHGVFRVSRAVIPLMFGQPSAIVNTASRAAKVPPQFNGAYAVAKAGVLMLTKVMARELASSGIRVNAVCPGQIRTDLEQWRFELEAQAYGSTVEEREQEMCTTIPLERIGTPAEVGAVVAFLASDEASYMTGQALNVTGGQLMEL
jgi:NAD(P)-dependent dehydrogenase (short-subunit alcohol dehydrogenase family)